MAADHDDFEAWRRTRWQEIAGPFGKAKVVAKARITGTEPHLVDGFPGRWNTTSEGALQITAAPSDHVVVDGRPVDGPVQVAAGTRGLWALVR